MTVLYPKHEQVGLEEPLDDFERKVEVFVLQASADLHACNDQKGTNSTNAAHKDDSRKEFDESAQSKVSKKEEGQAYDTDVLDAIKRKLDGQLTSQD